MIEFYNTLSRKKEKFVPIKGKKVNIFVCGPTVYGFAHLGHAKTYTQFDIVVKYLKYSGYNVFYLQNITDIDDKIIKKANFEKTGWKVIAKKYLKEYFSDMKSLGIDSITKYANATDYIDEIVSQVERLIEKGYAYKISDGYYFDLSKDKDYGKLAKRTTLGTEDSVSRIDENDEKKNAGDFCLWKFRKNNEPYWETKLGEGRPGWHIEDTAITEKEFGPQYDIHGGATDLIFPHHEAEIAQMESISGKKPLVKYWMHTGFLKINKEKMSKSLGNFLTIKDMLKKYDAGVLRYFFISSHYRKSVDFSEAKIGDAKNSLQRLKKIISEMENDKKTNKKYLAEFENSMDDDINTPKALQVLWNLVRDENASGKFKTIKKMDEVFGLNLFEKEKMEIPANVKKFAEERNEARNEKNWKKADELRERISKLGYVVEDNEKGFLLRKK